MFIFLNVASKMDQVWMFDMMFKMVFFIFAWHHDMKKTS